MLFQQKNNNFTYLYAFNELINCNNTFMKRLRIDSLKNNVVIVNVTFTLTLNYKFKFNEFHNIRRFLERKRKKKILNFYFRISRIKF